MPPTPSDDLPPLPTFLIIGAQKCATRWLRSNLGRHPEIYAAPSELWFFNNVDRRFHERGTAWYRAQFEGWAGEPHLGEATPGYMMLRHDPEVVARRIGNTVPDVRLLAIVRDPVERAQSAVRHQVNRGRLPADADLLAMVRRDAPEVKKMELISGGWYATSLRPYIERFGDQLLVLLNEDIAVDAAGVYRAATGHIGADTGFIPRDVAEVRFSNRDKRKAEPARLTDEARHELYPLFADEIAELEELIGRDLSAWTPSTAAAR